MKNSNQCLVISLIVHLLLFIVLAYVVLPPVNKSRELLDRLPVDFVEISPVVRKEIPPKAEVEPEKKSEPLQTPKSPALVAFSPSVEGPVIDGIRVTSGERAVSLRGLPEVGSLNSVQPSVLRPITGSTDDGDVAVIPTAHKGEERLASSDGATGFSGHQVGPIGSERGSRGLGEQRVYLPYPDASPQQGGEADEFADILPALARGILERVTQRRTDIVFVIDTTGSMRDNVRGVKKHIHHFLEPLEENGVDAALGLVEFTDLAVRKAKAIGLARNQKEFTRWLDRTRFFGGGDIPESGYEALVTALEEIDFRDGAQRFLIFMSDAPQHDIDYDGKSRYSLDRIIARMNDAGVRVDVVGANHMPVKQLAWGTGGQWQHIPGGDPLMDGPRITTSTIRSQLGRSLPPVLVEDKVTIDFDGSVPDWVDLSYKVLDPRGLKCLGTLTYRKKVYNKEEGNIEFFPKIDLGKFGDMPGTYTLIYRIRDSIGNWDVLRRTLELHRTNS